MEVKLHTKPSALQKLLKRDGIGSVDFSVAVEDDPAVVRVLRPLVPVSKEQVTDFNPQRGSLQFTGKANKKMLRFLEAAREHIPQDHLPPNYQQVLDYLSEKYHH